MSVLSLPVVFSQSTSPCLEACCILRSARFLRESQAQVCAGARRGRPPHPAPGPATQAHLR